MSCTERCRKALPGACCCECGGAHHGEAGPQKRLGLVSAAVENEPDQLVHVSEELLEACHQDIEQMLREAATVEVHDEACDCAACLSEDTHRPAAISPPARAPFDMDIGGRIVHLSPGNRWTPDSVELIWIAQYQGKRASHVDPEAAARKVIA